MNLSWLQNMPKFTHADFGSPWSKPTRWGVINHLDEPQDKVFNVNYMYSTGQAFNSHQLNGNMRV